MFSLGRDTDCRDREHTTVLIGGLAKGVPQALIESFFESVSVEMSADLIRSAAEYVKPQYWLTILLRQTQPYSNFTLSIPWHPLWPKIVESLTDERSQ